MLPLPDLSPEEIKRLSKPQAPSFELPNLSPEEIERLSKPSTFDSLLNKAKGLLSSPEEVEKLKTEVKVPEFSKEALEKTINIVNLPYEGLKAGAAKLAGVERPEEAEEFKKTLIHPMSFEEMLKRLGVSDKPMGKEYASERHGMTFKPSSPAESLGGLIEGGSLFLSGGIFSKLSNAFSKINKMSDKKAIDKFLAKTKKEVEEAALRQQKLNGELKEVSEVEKTLEAFPQKELFKEGLEIAPKKEPTSYAKRPLKTQDSLDLMRQESIWQDPTEKLKLLNLLEQESKPTLKSVLNELRIAEDLGWEASLKKLPKPERSKLREIMRKHQGLPYEEATINPPQKQLKEITQQEYLPLKELEEIPFSKVPKEMSTLGKVSPKESIKMPEEQLKFDIKEPLKGQMEMPEELLLKDLKPAEVDMYKEALLEKLRHKLVPQKPGMQISDPKVFKEHQELKQIKEGLTGKPSQTGTELYRYRRFQNTARSIDRNPIIQKELGSEGAKIEALADQAATNEIELSKAISAYHQEQRLLRLRTIALSNPEKISEGLLFTNRNGKIAPKGSSVIRHDGQKYLMNLNLTPKDKELIVEWRNHFSKMGKDFGRSDMMIDYYAPKYNKFGEGAKGKRLDSILNPTSEQHKYLDILGTEKDVGILAERYLYEGLANKYKAPIFKEASVKIDLLNKIGATKEAAAVEDWLKGVLGVKTKRDISSYIKQVINKDLAEQEVLSFKEIFKDIQQTDSELYNSITKNIAPTIYSNLISGNLNSYIKQVFQNFTTTVNYISPKHIVKGFFKFAFDKKARAEALRFAKDSKTFITSESGSQIESLLKMPENLMTKKKALMLALAEKKIPFYEVKQIQAQIKELDSHITRSQKIGEALKTLPRGYSKLIEYGMVKFNQLDTANRAWAYLAGKEAAKKSSLNQLIKSVNDSPHQVLQLQQIAKTGNQNLLAETYGKIIQDRSQFRYLAAYRPVALDTPLKRAMGQFVVWPLEIPEMMLHSIRNKNFAGLAYMLTIPATFSYITGVNLSPLYAFGTEYPPVLSMPIKFAQSIYEKDLGKAYEAIRPIVPGAAWLSNANKLSKLLTQSKKQPQNSKRDKRKRKNIR